MTHEFDQSYWERHWQDAPGTVGESPPHPYLLQVAGSLTPGTALDAGSGAGAEAIWLAAQGWEVTAADISREALAQAAQRASGTSVLRPVTWLEADLSTWTPDTDYDLVTTHYAHPAMPQLAFYERISAWVAPGGSLLVVGHLHRHGSSGHEGHEGREGHEQHPPAEAAVTAADITALLDESSWEVIATREQSRTHGGEAMTLHDVVVHARRRA